ncbi:DUF4159 domain-containing protein [Novispirillum itersonii]|uniref:Uncharacterized protein n=1 Tax=Novispirillum itersonii TaxID=189 RepID=A0A7W9ZCP4_NOVIT|nr:DUF4159 domain-containing protein [Novispirillum itersonii]MBB6209001.1 hypothetical protein [Novispirillum itersonii]
MTLPGSLALLAPEALFGLLALPLLWVLLRLMPPPPKTVTFPPLRLLAGLTAPRPVAERTPLWILLLRTLIVVCGLLGLSHPVLTDRSPGQGTDSPLLLIVDSGWSAAPGWEDQRQAAGRALEQAARLNRTVLVAATAAGSPVPVPAPVPESAAQALSRVQGLSPRPWPADLRPLLAAVTSGTAPLPERLETLWISDGLRHPDQQALLEALQRKGPVRLLLPDTGPQTLLLTDLTRTADGLTAIVHRPRGTIPPAARTVILRAEDARGQTLAALPVSLEATPEQTVTLPVPPDAVSSLRSLRLTGAGGEPLGAGALLLTDDRWQRRPVGIIETTGTASDLPLLAAPYYLLRALGDGADVRTGPVQTLLDQRRSVLILPGGLPPAGQAAALTRWVEDGGVLIRFADADLAEKTGVRSDDPLLPVPLRSGGRSMGGQLSWEAPLTLAPFPATGPFAGLIPAEVTITTQVLAEPLADLASRTWARLSDGTPLVTGLRRGQGWVVLFHTTANTDWGTLPLSGTFPQMLSRLLALSSGQFLPERTSATGPVLLPPQQVVDGTGHWQAPGPDLRSIPAADDPTQPPLALKADTPPGLYGRDGLLRALSVGGQVSPVLDRLEDVPAGVALTPAAALSADRDLRGLLYTAALLLLLADGLCTLLLRGGRVRVAAAAILLLAVSTALPPLAQAADPDLEAALETRLGWISSGNGETDAVVRSGLSALTKVLSQRTAAELGEPAQVQPDSASLSLYPMLYWAVTDATPTPDTAIRQAISRYLDHGGLIVFDARDTAQVPALHRVVQALDLPPVARLPADHVLTRSFYLLHGLPGRVEDSAPWIGQAAARGQGISPVVIGAADWAGAWARDGRGRPLLPAIPGGERQRELAFRAGVNLVMYALTGDYKADQVHLPAIMERLTQ